MSKYNAENIDQYPLTGWGALNTPNPNADYSSGNEDVNDKKYFRLLCAIELLGGRTPDIKELDAIAKICREDLPEPPQVNY